MVSVISNELRQKMELWLASVKAFLNDQRAGFPEGALNLVDELVDHSEAPEGLLALAWLLEEKDGSVSPEVARRLVELTGGFITKEEFPPSVIHTLDLGGV